ncbi:hypothetical protein ACFL2O_10150 [Thermodesulfobacteriota bacterium]
MKGYKKGTFRYKLASALVLVTCGLFAASCTSTLSTRASHVRLVSAVQAHEVENQCEFLGNVSGTPSFWGYVFGGVGMFGSYWTYSNEALNEMLDNAAELGATHVFVNRGNSLELRGEAFVCAYCRLPDGTSDAASCRGPDGEPDSEKCVDEKGTPTGPAHCEGAEAEGREQCAEAGGKWISTASKAECESQGKTWVTEAKTRRACEEKKGAWVPRAGNRVGCEAKGGEWVTNDDVLRLAPSPAKGKEEE